MCFFDGIFLGCVLLYRTSFDDPLSLIPSIVFFLIWEIIGVILALVLYYDITIELSSNSIIVNKKALFRNKTIIYTNIELEKAEIYYTKGRGRESIFHYYKLFLILKSGKKEKLFTISLRHLDPNPIGLKYFTDLLNAHIQGGMKIYKNL